MKPHSLLLIGLLLSTMGAPAAPLGTAFTYQGRLNHGAYAANNLYDLDFALFDVPTGGSQLGLSATFNGLPVTNGLFTVTLDFGASPFNGDARWLQVQVRTNAGRINPYTILSPRQALTPAPYALYAPNAGNAFSIAPGAVTSLSLATGAVNTDKLADGSVTAADLSSALISNTFWRLGGNAGTVPGPHFLGTTDNFPVELKVNGQRALRLEPGLNEAPNVVGGSSANTVAPGVLGAIVAGGGAQGGANTIQNSANFSTIAGGYGNTIQTNGRLSAIGGGGGNLVQTNAYLSTIGGGADHLIQANAKFATIGGGEQNTVFADAYRSTISGGSNHRIGSDATNCFIGGGFAHYIQFNLGNGTIAGGARNSIYADSHHATIGGGGDNTIQNDSPQSTIAGGLYNLIRSDAFISTIGGGAYNLIQTNANSSTIGGGRHNMIEGLASDSVISGGSYNTNGRNAYYATISGGGGNRTGGPFSTVAGGVNNLAGGSYSLAAGRRAKAIHPGAFVWADSTDADYASTGNNQFCIRATGGLQLSPETSLHCGSATRQMLNLYSTNYGIGVQSGTLYFRASGDSFDNGFAWYRGGIHHDGRNSAGGGQTLMLLSTAGLTVNGTVVSSSDRNRKENFAPVSPRVVLDQVVALPISRWNFKDDNATTHLGPMAQDFHAAFGVGADDKHIATVDADGVALAAIQGLNQKLEDRLRVKDAEIHELRNAVTELKEMVRRMAR